MEPIFYEDFYKLVSVDNDKMEKLLIQCYKNNNYKMFIVILKNIKDITLTPLVGKKNVKKMSFLDQLLDDDDVDDWQKFRFFYHLECCENVKTNYTLRLLYKIKNLESKYIDYIICDTHVYFTRLYGVDFLLYLLDRETKITFNNVFIKLLKTKFGDHPNGICTFILTYYKHPYFDHDYFLNKYNMNLLLHHVTFGNMHDIDLNIDSIIDFLNSIINNKYDFLLEDLYHVSLIFSYNMLKIIKNEKYIPIWNLLIDYYIKNDDKRIRDQFLWDNNNEYRNEHNICTTICGIIQQLCSQNCTFHVSENLYNKTIASSKQPYFTKDIDNKIKNMYIKQEKIDNCII